MKFALGFSTVSALLFASALAWGHAHLESAEPKMNEILTQAPTSVTIHVSEAVEPKFSKIEVTQEKTKERVDQGEVKVTGDNKDTLEISLKNSLAPGKYRVKWKVMSVDTHRSGGMYDFTYEPKK